MRFDLIDIPAFGPFTDFTITLPPTDNDIHLIYGANEAGKSSLLRGIHQMFYGIPTRSNDNFIHANAQLRTGAQISTSSETLHFHRKKGNKNTLLDKENNSIPDDSLKPFLGSVDDGFFSSMFGLNTQNLREGAQALLDPKSDLGTQLFSASMGGSPIDVAIKKLEDESDSLFKGKTQSAQIVAKLKIHNESEKLSKSESIKASTWDTLKKNITASEAEFTSANEMRRAHSARVMHISNVLSAMPNSTKLRDLDSQLNELDAPSLPSDFTDRYRKLTDSIKENDHDLAVLRRQIKKDKENLALTPEFSHIILHEDEIESVQRNIATHLFQITSIEDSQLRLKKLANEIDSFISKLELSTAEEILELPVVSAKQLSRFKQIAGELDDLELQHTQTQNEYQRLEADIKSYKHEIQQHSDTADTSTLEALLDKAKTSEALQKQHVKNQQKTSKLSKHRDALIAQLSLDILEPDEAVRLSVPSFDSIKHEQQRESDLLDQLHEHRTKCDAHDDEKADHQAALNQFKKKDTLYTLSDLTKARESRDQLVRSISKTSEDIINDDNTLADTIATAIAKADTIADTLHSNAEAIAIAETHQTKIEALTAKRELAEKAIAQTQEEMDTWSNDWKQRCANIPAPEQTPTDLLQWRERWDDLCDTVQELSDLLSETDSHDGEVESILQTMRATLQQPSLDFATLISKIEAQVKLANQAHGKQQAAEKSQYKAELEFEKCTTALGSINQAISTEREAWAKLCTQEKLPHDLNPLHTVDLILLREKAQSASFDHHQLNDELEDLCEKTQQFEKSTQSLASNLAGDTPSLDTTVENLAKQLKSALTEAQHNQTTSTNTQKSIDAAENNIPPLSILSDQLKKELLEFYLQAHVENSDAMESAIINIEKHVKLTEMADTLRGTLTELAEGTPLDTFLAQLEQEDVDTLKDEKSELAVSADLILHQRDEAKSTLDQHRATEKELLQAGDSAAKHKQDAVNALSSIITDTDRYIKLQHAIHFLKQQVEAYREKNQGPMIKKTSHYFNALTSGSFSGVAAQIDTKSIPQLVALRAEDKQQISTSGLSEGTGDQLYLALRLAAIDLHLDSSDTPIPLILDDLLITFDDDRTRALLPVLETLSKKTQVLIFTHHKHLIDLTKKFAPAIQQHII